MSVAACARIPGLSALRKLALDYASPFLALCFALAIFFVLKYFVITSPPLSSLYTNPHPSTFLFRMAVVLLLALACSGIRMSALELPLQRFLRVLIPVVGIYVFAAGPVAVPADTAHKVGIAALIALAWAALPLAVLAWWRPAFLLPLVALLLWQKQWLAVMNDGYSVSPTDYMPLFDTVLLTLAAIGTLKGLVYIEPWQCLERRRQDAGVMNPLMFVFMATIAIHLSNYFHSGTAKIFLDGGPLSWVLENRTDMLSHVTWELGFMPLAAWPFLGGLALAALAPPVVQIVNALTLASQLLAPLAAISRRLLIFILLFFDLQHITIYLLTGIAFWKWVALNAAFAVALVRWERPRTPVPLVLVMVFLSTVVLVLPEVRLPGYRLIERGQPFFFTARLGWYDSPAANNLYLTALLQDGREVKVPSNYFLSYSILFAQQRMSGLVAGMWPTGTWGATGKYDIMKGGLDCDLPLTTTAADGETREKFIDFVRRQHVHSLARADANGHLAYDIYPHHVWSNPALYREFAALDLRQITGFRLNFETVCADWSGGERRTKLISHQTIDIPLDEDHGR